MILSNHKLSTRNNFTGKAINNLDNTSIKQLIDGNPCYIEYENKYIQRRFHQNSYLSQLKAEHKQKAIEQDTINQHTASPASLEKLLNEHEKHDIMVQKRFDKFSKIHDGQKKPLLILDIDNTMLYARFFSDEMKIGDIVTYFSDESVAKNNAKVLKLQKTLYLDIINGQLIDKLGTEHTEISLWIQDNDTLHKYKKGGIYDYNHNNNVFQCKISRTDVTGCMIEVRSHEILDDDETEDEAEYDDVDNMDGHHIRSYTESYEIEISFVEENEHLSKLEPCLNRVGYLPVDFIYEGFLIRLRPNLDEFLEYASDDFDIVVYTSAVKGVYKGLLKVLHSYIKDQLGRDDDDELTLWTDVLFRDDCILKTEHRAKPYHWKDLTLFGCDLSRVVMIDNSPIVVSGQEPNIILIRDFFGKDQLDDEFMEVYTLLDTIKDIKGDIRYFLCDIDDICDAEEVELDLLTEQSCKQITTQFVNILKKEFKQNNGRRASISISHSTKRYSLSQSNVGNQTALIAQTSDKIQAPHHSYAATTSSPILLHGRSQPIWQTKMEQRKKALRAKWKGHHKSLLCVNSDFGKLAMRRHSRYSSMSPKLKDSTNFDIQATMDEGTTDLLIMDILTEGQQEAIDIDAKFDFAENYYEENDGDITDYEQDEDEYILLIPAPITKPKKKRAVNVVKFRGMTSADIRAVHEDIDKYGNGKQSVSPSESDTKPLRIEFAMIDDDEDEKILVKQQDEEINSLKKWTQIMDEEKIYISNEVNHININNTDSTTEPLLLSDGNDKNKNKQNKQNKKNINKQKKKKKSRLERELNENNSNGFCRLFCGL